MLDFENRCDTDVTNECAPPISLRITHDKFPLIVNALPVIKQACIDALEEERFHRAAYTSVVDPLSVLEMAGIIEEFIQYATDKGDSDRVASLLSRTQ